MVELVLKKGPSVMRGFLNPVTVASVPHLHELPSKARGNFSIKKPLKRKVLIF